MPENYSPTFDWFFSLAAKFFHAVPLNTAMAVILTFTSQTALLISLLLPLKIIMLMATGGGANFLPEPFKSISTENLVLSLTFLTLFFYFIQHILDKLSQIAINKGTHKLLKQSEKIALFENQNEIATEAYKKFTAVLSSLTFCIVAIGALGYVYIEVAAVILFYLLAYTALNISMQILSSLPGEELQKNINQNIPSAVNIGFFVIFLFIVTDFLYLTPPVFIFALITIILSRQVLAQFGQMIRNTSFLQRHKEKISSLFFHHNVFSEADKKAKSHLWELLVSDTQFNWVGVILAEYFEKKPKEFKCTWFDTGIDNIACFEITLSSPKQKLLLKLFDSKRLSLAQHEASLLIDSPSNLPSPPLILTTTVNNLPCHVFDISELFPLQNDRYHQALEKAQELLLSINPPEELRTRYCRSKELLGHRIKLKALTRLEIIAENEEKEIVIKAIQLLPKIREMLGQLPLTIVNNDTKAKTFLCDSQGNIKLIHWGKWTLEPIGATWPASDTGYTGLHTSINIAAQKRTEIRQHEMTMYELTSLLYEFERKLRTNYFKEALSLLPDIIERTEEDSAYGVNHSTSFSRSQ